MLGAVTAEQLPQAYADVFGGDERWQALQVPAGDRFEWDEESTYIRHPPFFEGLSVVAGAAGRHHGRPRARAARRQRDDRPHLAGRIDPAGQPGRAVPGRARRAARATSTPTARGAATTR